MSTDKNGGIMKPGGAPTTGSAPNSEICKGEAKTGKSRFPKN